MNGRRKTLLGQLRIPSHYVIDGMRFPSVMSVHSNAIERGFNGGVTAIQERLRAGATTWAELIVPVDARMAKIGKSRRKHNEEARAEMAALCAELDARKAQRKAA